MILKRKPRLTIDIGPLMELQWTGIPVFTRRVVQSMLAQDEVEIDFAYDLVKMPNELVVSAIACNSGGFLRDSYERNVGEQLRLVDRRQPIFYPTVKQHFGMVERESSTVHDMSTLVMPENHETANIDFHLKELREELSSDDAVFCVSAATEAALLAAYPSVRGKTRLLYQYADWPDSFERIERNLPPPVMGRYAAVIGTLEPRKNLGLLLSALKEPAIRDSDLKFVVIGRKGWKVDAFLQSLTPAERERVIFSGFVTEFIKYRLLRHCEFLVFPSIYEGFGIPALEAMTLGKPVLAAMTSSFPEVIGKAGIYFDPLSASDFAEGFREIEHPDKYRELVPYTLSHAATFNAGRMAGALTEWIKQH